MIIDATVVPHQHVFFFFLQYAAWKLHLRNERKNSWLWYILPGMIFILVFSRVHYGSESHSLWNESMSIFLPQCRVESIACIMKSINIAKIAYYNCMDIDPFGWPYFSIHFGSFCMHSSWVSVRWVTACFVRVTTPFFDFVSKPLEIFISYSPLL